MTDDWYDEQKIKVYKPSKELQEKAGTGTVSPEVIARADKVIEENDIDFVPMATEYLGEIENFFNNVDRNSLDLTSLKNSITLPIMQLKANGSIFKYSLVSDLATIMLSFLEAVDTLDDDVFDILYAGYNTIKMVINNSMKGDGGNDGYKLRTEMYAVCDRYMKKYKTSR